MTVVVGYLPTPEGRAALDAAIEEAAARSARLTVVNAARGGAPVDQHLANDEELAEVQRRCAAAGVDSEVLQPQGADPVDQLLELAGGAGTSLLVIGLRRRSPVGKLLLGSASQRLLLDAECPVLAVKARL